MRGHLKSAFLVLILLSFVCLGLAKVCAAGTIKISGRIMWTDSRGGTNTHPVRSAPVEVVDAKPSQPEQVLTTLTTDELGNYSTTLDTGPMNTRDIYIRVSCSSSAVKVHPPLITDIYFIRSDVHRNVGNGADLTISLTTNNTDDNNTAFSVRDAVIYLSTYVRRLTGTAPGAVDVVFPTNLGNSQYFKSKLNILEGDRWDWDVIMHEYGHYVSDINGLDDNPGGEHHLDDHLAETGGRNKDGGIRMAWAEGWPSYFSISAQQVLGLSAIPNVGDSRYTDTEDASIDYDLAATNSFYQGEDNEVAVQRIIYAMYRSVKPSSGGTGLGDSTVWKLLTDNKTKTLFAGWTSFVKDKGFEDQGIFGAVFTEQGVAPLPNHPADGITVSNTPPTFDWTPNGAGPRHRNNRFTVVFYDANWKQIFTSPELQVSNYTPTQADWNIIKTGGATEFHWVVLGRNIDSPVTGPYMSQPRKLKG